MDRGRAGLGLARADRCGGRGGGPGETGRSSPGQRWRCSSGWSGWVACAVQAQYNSPTEGVLHDDRNALAETREAKKATEQRWCSRRSRGSERRRSASSWWRRSAAPTFEGGREIKVADVLDRAVERLHERLAGSPETEGRCRYLRVDLSWAGPVRQCDRGPLKARPLLEAALGLDHPDSLANRHNLAAAYSTAGRAPEAIRLGEETLKAREAKLGPDHPDTFQSRIVLGGAFHEAGRYADAIAMDEATLRRMEATLGPTTPTR